MRTGVASTSASWHPHQHQQLTRPWWSRFSQLRAKSTTFAAAPPHATAAPEAAAAAAATGLVASGGEALAAGVSPALRRQLQWWMAGTAAWVYTLVVIGGITRLTRSGLSMTEWKFTGAPAAGGDASCCPRSLGPPCAASAAIRSCSAPASLLQPAGAVRGGRGAGERPPLTDADWAAEFSKYQQSPEFKLIHSRMTLDEFKFIFWMEYGHRWGTPRHRPPATRSPFAAACPCACAGASRCALAAG